MSVAHSARSGLTIWLLENRMRVEIFYVCLFVFVFAIKLQKAVVSSIQFFLDGAEWHCPVTMTSTESLLGQSSRSSCQLTAYILSFVTGTYSTCVNLEFFPAVTTACLEWVPVLVVGIQRVRTESVGGGCGWLPCTRCFMLFLTRACSRSYLQTSCAVKEACAGQLRGLASIISALESLRQGDHCRIWWWPKQ